jgi:hypothetical protein
MSASSRGVEEGLVIYSVGLELGNEPEDYTAE